MVLLCISFESIVRWIKRPFTNKLADSVMASLSNKVDATSNFPFTGKEIIYGIESFYLSFLTIYFLLSKFFLILKKF